jgi:hypothetical protein
MIKSGRLSRSQLTFRREAIARLTRCSRLAVHDRLTGNCIYGHEATMCNGFSLSFNERGTGKAGSIDGATITHNRLLRFLTQRVGSSLFVETSCRGGFDHLGRCRARQYGET